jgi:hypothetical protein
MATGISLPNKHHPSFWARFVRAMRGLFSSRRKRPVRVVSVPVDALVLHAAPTSALDDDCARPTAKGADLEIEKESDTSHLESLREGDLGYETIDQARLAVKHVLCREKQLRELVDETVVDETDYQRPIRSCGSCKRGRLHYVGRMRLPDGRLGLGGLVVCDRCGFHESRRR